MRKFAFAAMMMCAAPASALCSAPKDMNGTWRGNDGGIYYVRQVGNNVWWLGVSAKDDGKSFSNVFRGSIKDGILLGTWADVRGTAKGAGSLEMKISGVNAVTGWTRLNQTGGFAAKFWSQPCEDGG